MDTLEDPDGDYYMALPKGTRLFEYCIESVLGQGGFGITYLANDTLLDEAVAIKEYFPNECAYRTRELSARAKSPQDRETFRSGLEAFLGEARIIARFRHRNIMQVRRFFEANGTAYIVLQFETGRSFEEVIAAGALPEKEVLPILAGILDGLEAVHDRAILHRDIKPRNVIVRQDGTPVLIDFGAARDFSSRDSQTVTKMASPGYSPPEQYGVGSQQGPWSDFYALGAMMYRVVTGKVPVDSLRRLRSDPLVPAVQAANGRYSKTLLRAIDYMIRIDERERPTAVAEIKALLSPLSPLFAARVDRPPAGPKPPAEPRQANTQAREGDDNLGASTTSSRRAPLWAGIGGLALIVIVVAAVVNFRGTTPHVIGNGPTETLTPADQSKRDAADADRKRDAEAARNAQQSNDGPKQDAETPDVPGKDAPVKNAQGKDAQGKDTQADTPADFTPGRFFRDCPSCPEMAVLAPGHFEMGSNDGFPNEAPAHDELIPAPFAIGRRPVTFAEWDACVADGGCDYQPGDQGWGRDLRPVINVNWQDAQTYINWLSKKTGHLYSLPTEAAWEYAARAGSTTAYPWGSDPDIGHANCADCLTPRPTQTQPTGSYAANAFGLYDTAGNVAEWVEDCWRNSYAAPAVAPDTCAQRVVRGGSFRSDARFIRSSARVRQSAALGSVTTGFRVVRNGPQEH